ncbi:MAG TPA: tetratricopeptide repeat protein, partial [Bacteroidales bacterium]|nr:tetratricopeptide repeat protein [Bacteroidales bacterium]
RLLELVVNNDLETLEAAAYSLLGDIYYGLDDWESTLRYKLKSLSSYSGMNMNGHLSDILGFLASRYYEMGVYNLAASYYIREFELYNKGLEGDMPGSSYNSAMSFFRDGNYDEALPWFETSAKLSAAESDTSTLINSLFAISSCYIQAQEFDDAQKILGDLITILESSKRTEDMPGAYSSLALTYFKEDDYSNAVDYYLRSASLLTRSGKSAHDAYSNVAICYQNDGNMQDATRYFEKALDEAKAHRDKRGQARLEHILAAVSKNKGDYYHADYYSNAAIESATEASSYKVLQDSYLTYSEVLEAGNDFVKALDYYEKYLSLRDSLRLERRLAEQADERRRSDLENLEQQLLLSLADEELKDVMIDKLRVENEKRQNEIELIARERELEKSERERLEQSIALAREKHEREMKEQEITNLEQERAIQRLELLRKENEEKELLRKNQLQESEIRQQQLEIDKEHEARKRAIWMVVLLGIIVILILLSFISSRRKNIKLLEQKDEISRQKDIIEEKNSSITDSIEYASRIQTAVLPPLNFFDEWGLENFILFKPKDIVSGDFYWGQSKGDLLCFAAADCTGHGVPGAFMSMLGNAFLNDIVNSKEYKNAGDILNLLRQEVIRSLKQRGMEGETQDGMDIALCIYNRRSNRLDFAGANNPLYQVRNNELLRIDADKMPIGIHRSSARPFTNHHIYPEKGDAIYLFSDGYADQFGGPSGKKFKYRAFRELLLKDYKKPMQEQKEKLDRTFMDWKGDEEQVDDVLVIGVRF